MKSRILPCAATLLILLMASCVHLTSPVGRSIDTSPFPALVGRIDPQDIAVSFQDRSHYPVLDGYTGLALVPWDDYRALPFDGRSVYFPFYVEQFFSRAVGGRFNEPERTIIGSHFVGVDVGDGRVLHGPIPVQGFQMELDALDQPNPQYYRVLNNPDFVPRNGWAVRNEPARVTRDTSVYLNQIVYYHPGLDRLPTLQGLLPRMAAAPPLFPWRLNLETMDSLEFVVLTRSGGLPGTIEAISIERGIYVGFHLAEDLTGTFLFLRFRDPTTLLDHIGPATDVDGYNVQTGFNDLGISRSGVFASGATWTGATDARGRQGHGVYTSPDGVEIFGTYRDNQLQGVATTTRPDGSVEYALFRDGEAVSDVLVMLPDETTVYQRQNGRLRQHQAPVRGLPDGWVYWGGDLEVLGVVPQSSDRIQSLRSDGRDLVVNLETESGTAIQARVRDGRVINGRMLFPNGTSYVGELQGLRPAGRGSFTTLEGETYFGRVAPTGGGIGPYRVTQSVAEVFLSFPTAQSVDIAVEPIPGQGRRNVPLSPGESGTWRGSVVVDPDSSSAVELIVNGSELVDSSLLRPLAGIRSFNDLREAPIATPDLSVSLRDEQALVPIFQTVQEPQRTADQTARQISRSIRQATDSYLEYAEAVWDNIAQQRAAALAQAISVTGQILQVSLEAMEQMAQAQQAAVASSGSGTGDSGGAVSVRILERCSGLPSASSLDPNSQLYFLVEAADRYHQQHVAAAQAGDADAAASYYQGHQASCQQVRQFQELNQESPGF